MKKLIITFLALFIGCHTWAADYQTFKLNNGQTLIVKEVKENPIVIVDTWIKTGSINETDQNNGVAHFLEHMFFKGTKKYPTGEFDKILESKGAVTNAATSKDFTHYYVTIPSKDFDTALEMHADMLLNPLIPRAEMEKERKVVLEEIAKNEDNPQSVLYKNLSSQLYKTHPYKRDVIGTRKVIETITREEMLDFYKTYYKPANMTTIIIGDVDTQTVLEKVNKLFDVQADKTPLPKFQKEKPLSAPSEKIGKADVQTAYMLIGFRGVDAKNKKETAELDVLSTILGDGVTSRLYKNVKDQKRLVQNISASNSTSRDDGLFYISVNFAPENLDKVKRAILEEVEAIQKNPPTQDEVNKAYSIIERDTYYSRESVSNIASEMGYIKTIFDDISLYDTYITNIKKVTPKEVQSAAKKFLDPKKMAVSIILPQTFNAENGEHPIANITEKNTSKEPVLVSQEGHIKDYMLKNGATLILNQNPTNDIIAIQIFVKGGKLLEKKAGIAGVTADGMQKGTKKYTKNEFSQILEEKGIKLSVVDGSESFNISLKTTKNELESSLDILNEVINNALFDDYEVEKIKADTLYNIKANRDKPFNVALEEFKEIIFQNSPYSKSTIKKVEKSLPTVTKSDITDYYKTIFNPKNAVISINGNLSETQQEEVKEFFSSVFKPTDAPKFDFKTYQNSVPPLSANIQKSVKKDTQASWIALGWQTCGLDNQKDYASLQVINSILGTGMSSRLFNHLRDSQGLAYQIGSFYSVNMNKGFFLTYIGTNPEKAEHATSEILREINVLKHEFVTQQELQSAKDKLIGNYILAQETNSEKAASMGWFEATGRGWEFYKKYPQLIQSVTPSDVISAANKYFSQPYVYSIVSPKESKQGR